MKKLSELSSGSTGKIAAINGDTHFQSRVTSIVHDQDLDHATASFESKLHPFGIKTASESDARFDYRSGRCVCQMFRAPSQVFPELGKDVQIFGAFAESNLAIRENS